MFQILISYNPEGYYYVFNRSPSNFSNFSETVTKKKKKKKRLVTPSFGIHDTKLSRYMGIRGVMCVAYSAFHPNRVARFLGHFQQINL